jgi:hypothetical protein
MLGSGDEGKVVKDGHLILQTTRDNQITENGLYDTTNNNLISVNVTEDNGMGNQDSLGVFTGQGSPKEELGENGNIYFEFTDFPLGIIGY